MSHSPVHSVAHLSLEFPARITSRRSMLDFEFYQLLCHTVADQHFPMELHWWFGGGSQLRTRNVGFLNSLDQCGIAGRRVDFDEMGQFIELESKGTTVLPGLSICFLAF